MSDELDVERMLGEGCVVEMRQKEPAQGNVVGSQDHTHNGELSYPLEVVQERSRAWRQLHEDFAQLSGELARAYTMLGFVTNAYLTLCGEADQEMGRPDFMTISFEELGNLAETKQLEIGADQTACLIRLEVKDK